nr:serine protease 40-like [Odocoileus virginianus texanus]
MEWRGRSRSRIRNGALKACRDCLEALEEVWDLTSLLQRLLRRLPDKGGFHQETQRPGELPNSVRKHPADKHSPQTWEVSVSWIITYPDFEKLHPFRSDIAMLQLLFPANFTSYSIPACLPVPGMKLPSNSSCWITSWGMLNEETLLLNPFHLQEGR